ncbi:hypothetical protein [Rhizobium ruizarguesonis]|uniref:hypothetical protein n=1 Tax=Rhizobium ruizarguesonis TaxID=2081791 RepID=UPI0013EEFB63|nr:hypothetical protein [Rhizobium ruizarguesonis]
MDKEGTPGNETDRLSVSGACTRSSDAQISASGQFFEQSIGGCFSFGQQGMSPVMEWVSADADGISILAIAE